MSNPNNRLVQRPVSQCPSFTWRALGVALILIPLNVYWVVQMEYFRYSAHPTTISLLFNAVFTLLILCALNALLRRLMPRLAFRQSELLLIYSMVCVGTTMVAHDFTQVLISNFTWSFWAASPENKWDELFNADLPSWLTVRDPRVMAGFYKGGVSPWQSDIISTWLVPLAMWTIFIIALVLVMACLNVLIRKQWLDNEHLACPLVSLPIEISKPKPWLFRNKLFWIGFGLAASMDVWNSFAFLYPAMPMIPLGEFNMGQYLTRRPWNAVGMMTRSFYPFVIGLGYLMPSDFLFSCWFFYLFWKGERVLSAAFGLNQIPGFPFANFQAFGAYLLFGLYALWLGRGYLRQLYNVIVGAPSRLRDDHEPLRYRMAALGIILGLGSLIWFSMALGMSLWVSSATFFIYYLLALAITRMRTQFGAPVHDLHYTGPDTILTSVLGSRFLPKKDLIGLALYRWFNRAYRGHTMPHQMEAIQMQDQTAGTSKGIVPALLLAAILGTLAAFWSFLQVSYSKGALTTPPQFASSLTVVFGNEFSRILTGWLQTPQGPRWGVVPAMGVGLAFAFLLQTLRMRYVNWPFHPLGFAISGDFEMDLIWMPLLVAWILKTTIIRYGGHKVYQRCVPIFMGLILGQFVVGSILNIVSIALHIPSYMFWQ